MSHISGYIIRQMYSFLQETHTYLPALMSHYKSILQLVNFRAILAQLPIEFHMGYLLILGCFCFGLIIIGESGMEKWGNVRNGFLLLPIMELQVQCTMVSFCGHQCFKREYVQ